MDAYEKLRISIILQLKQDYFKGYISSDKLWKELHSDWIMYLLGDIHPDEAYKALYERKKRYELFEEDRKDLSKNNTAKGNETKFLFSDIPERKKSNSSTGEGR